MSKSALLLIVFLLGPTAGIQAGVKRVWRKGDPWPYPPLKLVDVVLRSSVTTQDADYTYHYMVSNSSRNEFAIGNLQVDLRDYPLNHQLMQTDLTATHNIHDHFLAVTSTPRVRLIEKLNPTGWEFEKVSRVEGTDGHWAAEQRGAVGNTTINPGDSLEGFGMRAGEPPGIREFVVDADRSLLDRKYPLPCKTATECYFYDYSKEFRLERNKGIQYLGVTIAPVKPPDSLTISSWTARMTADAVEARKLKWIKTDGVLRDILRLVADLNVQDIEKMKTSVNNIENYVLFEKKKGNLTDEADALVRLNAQYLLRRLEKQEPVK